MGYLQCQARLFKGYSNLVLTKEEYRCYGCCVRPVRSLVQDIVQTIPLTPGWNWVSFNVEITLEDLEAALLETLPGADITIKGQVQNTRYVPALNKWVGNLTSDVFDVEQMYRIGVDANTEITLSGLPIDPLGHPIVVKNGTNWIANPLGESMTITNAFTGFAVSGDIIKGQNINARYVGGRWVGNLTTLEPGTGYIYISNVAGDRTLTFPMSN